ncbi:MULTISPECIES: class I SAM-dependent methyltransferase [Bacillus amyloliquefaciens group]|uniref:class I SAM-dependent methyltransferase n=1 Tax=Bacillus amyloliquefaciens group TaxID=1938374 RepID=UPI00070FE1F6|nr:MULTISPECIES: class I SAM-dependent methyltransferase [Bacillus amyloliquefaciens group]MCE4146621.1 class I SAM-dependent methyltransferase [Bacillus velezensis]NGM56880.1 class I SAM-dependent methyltransferase [Bacillus velezensis]PAE78176.1 class I SAM-dependent methyltransferase [Bacillus velezensis]UMU14323.1 class I SAM-dependent methyltransferase [Bacillus velezensis]UQX47631.1 class I SAM-dependent methyltransferase [Bacillus velezensis]
MIHDSKNAISDEGTEFFNSAYQEVYSNLLAKDLDDEINFIKNRILKHFENPKIMDFCCGHGRHLLKLWEEGYNIHGLDINENFLKHISDKSNAHVPTFLADGRCFVPKHRYHVVLNMETSIVYMSDKENKKMLETMYLCLETGGKLLLHLANREYLIKHFNPIIWFGNDESGYALEKRSLDLLSGTLKINQTRLINNKTSHHVITMRLYTVTEIKNALEQTGFNIEHIYGDFNGSEYTIESPSILVICSK